MLACSNKKILRDKYSYIPASSRCIRPKFRRYIFRRVYLNNLDQLHSRLIWINAFIRSYHCFLALYQKCDELDKHTPELSTFSHLHNVLLYDLVINWCKIFGVNSEECHWKHVVQDHDDFRSYLFNKLNITQSVFSEYQKSMLDFRNKWVVHFAPEYEHEVVPEFEIAYDSALALHSYIREKADPSIVYGGPKCMDTFGKDVSKQFISRLCEIKI